MFFRSEMSEKTSTRMERKVKGGGRRESLSKNWMPLYARSYLGRERERKRGHIQPWINWPVNVILEPKTPLIILLDVAASWTFNSLTNYA